MELANVSNLPIKWQIKTAVSIEMSAARLSGNSRCPQHEQRELSDYSNSSIDKRVKI
jgi:hypothetical protein